MAATEILLTKLAAVGASNENVQNGLKIVLLAVLAPAILIVALLVAIASGGAEHNNAVVGACFYGISYTEKVPAAYREHIDEMRKAFSLLDSTVASANSHAEEGHLDPDWIKSVFLGLCFGEDAPSRRAASRFTECFYTEEERTRDADVEQIDGSIITVEENYTIVIPLSVEQSYRNVALELDREITEDDKSNINYIYSLVAGSLGSENYDGKYIRGGSRSIDMDASAFFDASTKNASDLAAYAIHAWESGWGYVWGTYGEVLTESLLNYKCGQYPEGVAAYENYIRSQWLGGRTTDCVGLIKGYGWLDPETMTIRYGSNGMPDINADQMYHNAKVSGPMSTIPEIPGLAVWHKGHIGVYIGNGEVIEAMGTHYGVVRTKVSERNWTHWLKVPYINYD